MAALLGLRLLNRIPKVRAASLLQINERAVPRWISTSNKKSDVSATAAAESSTEACEVKEKRHWQSYGFSETDEREDLNLMHNHGFFLISIGLCLSIFIIAYRPEVNLTDWSQREAFLELRRRERLGLPLIDGNYVDPANIVLPTDEELGAFEIVI